METGVETGVETGGSVGLGTSVVGAGLPPQPMAIPANRITRPVTAHCSLKEVLESLKVLIDDSPLLPTRPQLSLDRCGFGIRFLVVGVI